MVFIIIVGLLLSFAGVEWRSISATATLLPTPAKGWNAQLIDGRTPSAQVKPGETFTTTWHVRNIGSCDWEGVELHLLDGASMEVEVIPVPDTRWDLIFGEVFDKVPVG